MNGTALPSQQRLLAGCLHDVLPGLRDGSIVAEPMPPRLFMPSPRQVNWLLIVGFLSLGEALYLRYLAIENAQVSLACQGGLDTWLCATFRLAIVLHSHSVFGFVALGTALLNLLRPSVAAGLDLARRERVRPRAAQCPSCRIGSGTAAPQPGASRACHRVSASAKRPAANQSACQLAKPSLTMI